MPRDPLRLTAPRCAHCGVILPPDGRHACDFKPTPGPAPAPRTPEDGQTVQTPEQGRPITTRRS